MYIYYTIYTIGMNQAIKDKIIMKFEGEDLREVVKDLKKQRESYKGQRGQLAAFTRVINVLEEELNE